MLKVQDIRELIKAIDQSSIEEFKYEEEGTKILLKKKTQQTAVQESQAVVMQQTPVSSPQVPQVSEQTKEIVIEKEIKQQAQLSTENLHKILSPMVGTFYAAPSPDSSPYVKKGDKVNSDQVVCIVEAMKLMNEIEAEFKGEIVEILVENGQLVEYGQELFIVKPE